MDTPDATVGFLALGEPDAEEWAALTWCRTEFETTRVRFDDIDDESSLEELDALWWHANEPIADPNLVADCAPAIRNFLERSGGLLLSSRALAQVSALGIEPIPPDATGTEPVETPVGILWKSVYADHPMLEGLQGLRHHTQPAGKAAPYARYEDVLPQRADVLAGAIRGDADVPTELTTLQWRPGDGTVVGIGQGVAFAGADAADTEANRERLVGNALRFLAGDAEFPLASGRPLDSGGLARHRRALVGDVHRPRFHLSPPANWLNDPNGCIRWNGRYHVFYQYNPGGPHHDTIHWGHAVSDDLLRWEDRPVALSPTPSGPDRDGCWSGCAVDDDGTPCVVYTGGRDRWQLPCLATAAADDLSEWVPEDNPVIGEPPAELDLLSTDHWHAEFRDHAVWQSGGRWYQLVGAGLEDVGGTVILYESPNLRDWEYVGPVLVSNREMPGTVWECPELLDFGEHQLLHVSNYEEVVYFVGTFDEDAGTFERERRGVLDPGDFYAPQSLWTDDGRAIAFGWLPEARGNSRQWDAGWAGTLSIPRELAVEDGRLHQRPVREFTDLRDRKLCEGSVELDDETRRLDAAGRAIELDATLHVDDATEVGLLVCATPDDAERTAVRYDGETLTIDRERSSLDPGANATPQSISVGDLEEPLDVRVFVDGSVVELFAGEQRALTSRIYPTRHDSTGVGTYAVDGTGSVDVTAWAMGDAWPEEARATAREKPAKTESPAPD